MFSKVYALRSLACSVRVVTGSVPKTVPAYGVSLHQRRTYVKAIPGSIPKYAVSEGQQKSWDKDGMLLISDALPDVWISQLSDMADELSNLEPSEGPWLKHFEYVSDEQTQLCRVENFCKHVPRWKELTLNLVQDVVSQVLREPAVLFKDKINYKGPGGAGFLSHQDATAYSTENLASRHVSVLVAVDEATVDNGCLQVVPGKHQDGIFKNEKGVVDPEVEKDWTYENILVKPGDLVLFDSFLPHRSDGNKTTEWRRSGYITFNKLSEGDLHEAYYAKKAEVWASGEGGSISINDDFGGKIVRG